MIPEAAVEAALLAMRELNFWDYNDADYIRPILEAAAPHMLTESPREAYVRGWKERFSRHGTAVELNPGVDITRAVHDAQPPTP